MEWSLDYIEQRTAFLNIMVIARNTCSCEMLNINLTRKVR